ncbi:helix-turn-helix domain-containing protein [Nocardia sp. NPDC059764]|uniref:helix-turn-helix domain-containing protein n=1 Tax=Nocardia sp. NPDC059764 TaxID=3346939 RepID=UPI00366092B2
MTAELAHLAGISAEYYQRLEQGRAANPSAEVLDSLAAALRLNPVEIERLHALARPALRNRLRRTASRTAAHAPPPHRHLHPAPDTALPAL